MDEISEMKSMLIEKAVLPERLHFSSVDPLEGTIAHLTRECAGNVADRGIIEITSNSVLNDNWMAKHVTDLTDWNHIFQSKTEGNQWIEWDFKTAEIEPTHYSIRTHGDESGGNHFQHWVLEGRIGDKKWGVLDERRSDSQLNGKCRIATFDITTRLRIRKIRLRQNGPNHRGSHTLVFTALEFFGDLLRHSS
jgi:hypothetical protein